MQVSHSALVLELHAPPPPPPNPHSPCPPIKFGASYLFSLISSNSYNA